MIENGFVHLPDTAPWLAQYLHELSAFPNGRHDDQVDSTAQMLDWFKQAGSGVPTTNAGIFEYYRQLAEEVLGQQAARERRVRLRVPSGIGRMNMLHLNVAADGTCEMSEEDAESFLRAGWVRVDASGAPAQQSGERQTESPEPLSVMAKEARHPPAVVTTRQRREPNAAAARVKRRHLHNVGFPARSPTVGAPGIASRDVP